MDPFSAIIAIVLIFQILKKGPEVVADMAQAAKESWDNAEHKARIKKLAAAGVAPATRGGALGRYLGNMWRTAQLEADAHQAAKAAKRAAAGLGPTRWQQRVAAAAARWHSRRAATPETSTPTSGARPAAGGSTVTPDTEVPADTEVPGTRTFTAPVDEPQPPVHTTATVGPRQSPDGDGWGGEGDRSPILVGAVVGPALALGAGTDNPTAPSPTALGSGPSGTAPALTSAAAPAPTTAPAIEGTTHMSTGTVEVTGVSSGAAAAAALAAAIQAATDEYVARLAAFQRQIAAMAEQAHGNVQLGTHSTVLANLAQAHEAAAAAMGQAAKVSGEVVPLMLAVRRSYLAIH